MKKPLALLGLIIIAAGTLFAAVWKQEETLVKLVNINNGFTLVEFKEGQPRFFDRFLEQEMREEGIAIPRDRQADFGGQETVHLDDPLFERAFVEIYVPLEIAAPNYQWQ